MNIGLVEVGMERVGVGVGAAVSWSWSLLALRTHSPFIGYKLGQVMVVVGVGVGVGFYPPLRTHSPRSMPWFPTSFIYMCVQSYIYMSCVFLILVFFVKVWRILNDDDDEGDEGVDKPQTLNTLEQVEELVAREVEVGIIVVVYHIPDIYFAMSSYE